MASEPTESSSGSRNRVTFSLPSDEELEAIRNRKDNEISPESPVSGNDGTPLDVENLSDSSKDNDDTESAKVNWTSEVDFVINCIGYSVGLGNLWRFPYYASINGGGAFLVAYIILTIFVTYPLVYMEVFLGQFSKLGPYSVWAVCPFFKGVGVSVMVGCAIVLVYYNVLMSYGLFFAAQVFRSKLPWADCEDWWGADELCFKIENGSMVCKYDPNCNLTLPESSADQFLRKYVLDLSTGIDDVGTVKWDLAFCLLATWIFVVLLSFFRHHLTFPTRFKTIYVTASAPFVVLIVYLLYAVTLPGAWDGLKYLFIPVWRKILKPQVWAEASQMSLYSLGVAMGGLVLFGAKNESSYKIGRSAAVTCFFDFLASFLASCVTFSVTGFMSKTWIVNATANSPHVELAGTELAFVTFPNAVLVMGFQHFWAFIFFSMFFLLCTDASIGMLEGACIVFNTLVFGSEKNSRRTLLVASSIIFLFSLTCVTRGGPFIIAILDEFAGGIALLGTIMFEAIAIGWGYRMTRASRDIKRLQGASLSWVVKLSWRFIIPITLTVLFVLSVYDIQLHPLYNVSYPEDTKILGLFFIVVILVPVPIWMLVSLWKNRKAVSNCFEPEKLWIDAVKRRELKDINSREELAS